MKNDPEFNIRFVQLIEKYPVLYNNTLENYANKWEVDEAWREISSTINETVTNCMSKWIILRNNFNRTLRETQKNGIESRRSYYLSKYMQFLIPFLKSRKHKRNVYEISPEDDPDIKPKQIKTNCEIEEIGEASNISQEKEAEAAAADEESFVQEENFCEEQNDNTQLKTSHFEQKQNLRTQESYEPEYISFLDSKKQKPDKSPDLEFFSSILPQVEKLSDSDKIQFRISVLQTLHHFMDKSSLIFNN